MSRRYSVLDSLTLAPQLELQQGGLVLTYDTNGTSSDRNARGTQALSGSRWAWECAAWGTEALTGTNVAFGILKTGVANNVRVGNVAGSVAFTPGDGGIWVDGVKVATVTAIDKQQHIQFALDLVGGSPTLQIRVNNLTLYSIGLPTGQSWLPAASIGGATAYGLNAFFNMGLRLLENTPPANYKPGVFINSQTGGSLFLASAAHRNSATGSPAHQAYQGRILDAANVYIEQGITFWTDGQSGTSWGAADVDLANEDGKLSYLLQEQPRNALVIWETLDLDHPENAPVRVGTTRVDRVTEPKRGVIRIKQRSPLSIYDDPLPRATIPPWADSGVANQVWPMALGAVRNAEPVLIDQVNRIYLLHDAPLTEIGVVRDKGDALDPTVDPPDYTPTPDLRGVIPHVAPVGKFVADVASTGSSHLTPGGSDLLASVGSMATVSGTMPTGWTDNGSAGVYCTIAQAWTSDGGGRLRVTYSTWQGQAFLMANASYTRSAVALTAGNRYRISFAVVAFTKAAAAMASSALLVNLIDSGGARHSIPSAVFGAITIGSFSADFTASINAVAIELQTYVEVYSGTVTATFVVDLDNVSLFQLPSSSLSPALDGIKLADYYDEILGLRAGAATSDWSSADVIAIDTAKPYPFGVYSKSALTTMAALRAPLDSYCAAVTADEYGVLRTVTLQDPAAMTPTVTVTYARAADAPLGDPDEARGLTLSAGGRYNWVLHGDSDFVANFDPVTGIDAATRTRFKRQCQFVTRSAVSMPDLYTFAEGAKELTTLFDLEKDIEAQHKAVTVLFQSARINYSFAFSYAWPMATILRPGMAVRVQCDWSVFAAGKNLYIKRIKHFPLACRYEISVGWG